MAWIQLQIQNVQKSQALRMWNKITRPMNASNRLQTRMPAEAEAKAEPTTNGPDHPPTLDGETILAEDVAEATLKAASATDEDADVDGTKSPFRPKTKARG